METFYAGKCINGHFVKVPLSETTVPRSNPRRSAKCACGSSCYVVKMDQEVTDTKCGGRCQQASNAKCHCSCGGENHGMSRIAFA